MLLNLKNLIGKYNIKSKGIIHIGAHYGEEHKLYEEIGIEKVVYFEPLEHNFTVLKRQVEKTNIEVILYNEALGNFIGETVMFVEYENNSQSSSILEPELHLKQHPNITFNDKKTVKVNKLNNYKKDIEKCNFINIDVQGYELEVFKGADEILNDIDYIITEVNRDEVYKNCAKVNELDEYLFKFGFNRVETTWDGHIWGDAFYIKNN